MKYLNERIKAEFSNISSETGLLQYRVYRLKSGYSQIDTSDSRTYDVIFIGNTYKSTTGSTLSIDITDIVRNDVWVPSEDALYNTLDRFTNENELVDAYYVYIVDEDAVSAQIQVAKVYHYPHHITAMQDTVFFDWTDSTGSASFPLQGRYSDGGKGKYHLMPRYPYISTDNYRMILASEVGLSLHTYTAQFRGSLVGSFTVPFVSPSSEITYTLTNLYNNATPRVVTGTFGSPDTPVDKFIIENHSGGIIVNETEQDTKCFCMLVYVPTGTVTIGERFTNSIGVGKLTVTQDFINKSGNLRLLFNTSSLFLNPSVLAYDSVPVTFTNLEVGQHIAFDFTPQEEERGEWSINNQSIPIPFDALPTQLEIAGDYVAQIDNCYSRYYLQWQDRMGGFQSQPFNDKYTYSESFETETLTDYQGRKRLSNVGVTGKFKINTDWIKEDLYPYYESIFTSPVLFLYDTKEDKRYSVLVTDSDYTEKTFNNQKRLFNLTLNLELNNKQNIVY